LSVRKYPSLKVGFRVNLAFYITQHTRDEELMRSFIDFFGCGNYRTRSSNKDGGDFYCTKFSDIQEKIIPFFKKYEIKGVKAMDD